MLEEAAGTGMYETKKIAAQKLISKKEAKLANLKDLITEEICPKIEKLKGEKEKYLELQKVTREAEHWGKIYTAFSYWSLLVSTYLCNRVKILPRLKMKTVYKYLCLEILKIIVLLIQSLI